MLTRKKTLKLTPKLKTQVKLKTIKIVIKLKKMKTLVKLTRKIEMEVLMGLIPTKFMQ